MTQATSILQKRPEVSNTARIWNPRSGPVTFCIMAWPRRVLRTIWGRWIRFRTPNLRLDCIFYRKINLDRWVLTCGSPAHRWVRSTLRCNTQSRNSLRAMEQWTFTESESENAILHYFWRWVRIWIPNFNENSLSLNSDTFPGGQCICDTLHREFAIFSKIISEPIWATTEEEFSSRGLCRLQFVSQTHTEAILRNYFFTKMCLIAEQLPISALRFLCNRERFDYDI